jgi:hypothetical protein
MIKMGEIYSLSVVCSVVGRGEKRWGEVKRGGVRRGKVRLNETRGRLRQQRKTREIKHTSSVVI